MTTVDRDRTRQSHVSDYFNCSTEYSSYKNSRRGTIEPIG